jgi:hypothetical protein
LEKWTAKPINITVSDVLKEIEEIGLWQKERKKR